MSRQSSTFRPPSLKPMQEPHAIWRGIGLILAILVPVLSWFGAEEMVALGIEQGWPFVFALTGYAQLPNEFYYIPVLADLARWLSSIPDLKAKLFFAFILIIVFSGIVTVLYASLYRMLVPRYTPFDEPAPRVIIKKRKL